MLPLWTLPHSRPARAASGRDEMTPQCRPDLTAYRVYIDVLLERLNQDSAYKMSATDLMKLLIEKAMANYCPDVAVKPKRKRYIVIDL